MLPGTDRLRHCCPANVIALHLIRLLQEEGKSSKLLRIPASYLLIFFLLFANINFSQSVEILGRVISKTDVENIHVINKTAKSFTVTNREGAFRITAKVNDTLQFSSIQQGVKNVTISKDIINI